MMLSAILLCLPQQGVLHVMRNAHLTNMHAAMCHTYQWLPMSAQSLLHLLLFGQVWSVCCYPFMFWTVDTDGMQPVLSWVLQVTGYVGIYTAISAWYIAFAELYNEVLFKGQVSIAWAAMRYVLATDCCCNAHQHGLFNGTKVCPLVWFPLKQKLLSSDKVVTTLHCLQYKPPECRQHTSIDLMDGVSCIIRFIIAVNRW